MDLWKDKLNLEKSLLESVLAAAEIIKITHSMTSRKEWSVKPQTVQQHGPKGNGSGSKPEHATATSCYDFSFLSLHHSSSDSLSRWTNFASSYQDALHLNPVSIVSHRTWPTSILRFHGRLLLHEQHVAQPACFLSHGPLTFYIRLGFSTMDIAWSVRWVTTYIRRYLLYLYL